jgi:hypothetical protein
MHLRFFGRRKWRAASQLVLTRGVAREDVTPPSQPRELIDVLGVGATETVGGIALTLLSVERYREAHIALFRLFRTRGRLEWELPSPHLDLAVTPEGTAPYRYWMMGGTGGGMRELEFRQSYAIAPAPPSEASEIVIEVRAITWQRYSAGTYKVVAVDGGPWRFRVRR